MFSPLHVTCGRTFAQFISGEDLLDPTRIKFLSSPSLYAMNADVFLKKWSRLGSADCVGSSAAMGQFERRHQALNSNQQPPQAGYHFGETSIGFVDQVGKLYRASVEKFSGRPAVNAARWREIMLHKYQSALQQPGESVGLLAAQVIPLASFPLLAETASPFFARLFATVGW